MKQDKMLKSAYIQLDLASQQLQEILDQMTQDREQFEPYIKPVDYITDTMYEVMEKIKICM